MDIDLPGTHSGETWASGDAYERYVGRWSRVVASEFLDWLGISHQGSWLDVGCGTGALTEAILKTNAPRAVTGIDSSAAFVNTARKKITDPRLALSVGAAQALPLKSAAFDVAISGFVLNFVPHPAKMVAEMARIVRPSGTVALYVWDYAGRMQFMRHFWNTAAAIEPAALALDEGRRFPFCEPGPLADLFKSAGLTDIQVWPIDIWTLFKDFDDFWLPFLGGQGPGPAFVMALDEKARELLRERLRAALPFAVDGSIPLIARAWAVRGKR